MNHFNLIFIQDIYTTSQIADMLPSKTIPEASNGKGPTRTLKPEVMAKATAPPKKKTRTCSVEVEEIEDEDSSRNIAARNGSVSSTSSFQIPNSKKVCSVLLHMILL
jgi:hypothetical protein